jgi:hypothetical protein
MKPMKMMKKTTMMMRTIKHMQITTIVFINNGQRIINDLVKYMIQKMTNHVQQHAAAVGTKKRKEQQQFSKSFEVSLDDLDNLIDRVDNGIKLKKSNNNKSNDTPKKQQQQQQQEESTSTAQATINIESLKQEWSNMFNKLEQDYKSKLDEQQKQNEFRLKQLHDEIKQSILLQHQQKEQNVIIFLT